MSAVVCQFGDAVSLHLRHAGRVRDFSQVGRIQSTLTWAGEDVSGDCILFRRGLDSVLQNLARVAVDECFPVEAGALDSVPLLDMQVPVHVVSMECVKSPLGVYRAPYAVFWNDALPCFQRLSYQMVRRDEAGLVVPWSGLYTSPRLALHAEPGAVYLQAMFAGLNASDVLDVLAAYERVLSAAGQDAFSTLIVLCCVASSRFVETVLRMYPTVNLFVGYMDDVLDNTVLPRFGRFAERTDSGAARYWPYFVQEA